MFKSFAPEWEGFEPGRWSNTSVNVRDFIQKNITPYDGDESFLEGPTEATTKLWEQVMDLSRQEREAGGVLDMDTKIISTITSHGPGYLNKDLDKEPLRPYREKNRGVARRPLPAREEGGHSRRDARHGRILRLRGAVKLL